MIQARYSAATKYPWNQGRLEVGTLLGILVNTLPSSFYMLVQIYSDPALLQDIRDELSHVCFGRARGDKAKPLHYHYARKMPTITLDVPGATRTSCPGRWRSFC